MSDEKDLNEREEALRQKAVALNFMRKHLYDYAPCAANSELLGRYLEDHNLSFTEDNLELAAEALGDKLAASTVVPPSAAPLPPPEKKDELPAIPAGQNWPTTREEVNAMPRNDFRLLYHSKKYGPAFRKYVEAIYNEKEGV